MKTLVLDNPNAFGDNKDWLRVGDTYGEKDAHDVSDEERDERGRWTGGATGTPAAVSNNVMREEMTGQDIQLRGMRAVLGDSIPKYAKDVTDYQHYVTNTNALALDRAAYAQITANSPQDVRGEGPVNNEDLTKVDRDWASDSNNAGSLGYQQAIAEHFDVPETSFFKDKVDAMGYQPGGGQNFSLNHDIGAAAAQAQYDYTQSTLEKAGIDNITLYRGMEDVPQGLSSLEPLPDYRPDAEPTSVISDRITVQGEPVAVGFNMQPLSSWTTSPITAEGFGRYVMAATFPRERIYATSFTGLGAQREQEWLPLGGPTHATLRDSREDVPAGFKPFGQKDHDVSGEARDEHGRWTDGGSMGDIPAAARWDENKLIRDGIMHVAGNESAVKYKLPGKDASPHEQARVWDSMSRADDVAVLLDKKAYDAMSASGVNLPEAVGSPLPEGSNVKAADINSSMLSQTDRAWAQNSNSVEMLGYQQGVAEALGIPTSPAVQSIFTSDTEVSARPYYEAIGRGVAQAQYDYTQKTLQDIGVRDVTLYRGMSAEPVESSSAPLSGGKKDVTFNMQPLSSWSTDSTVAERFAQQDGYVMSTRLPISRIYATSFTGLGALSEKEVVVLGGPTRAVVQPTQAEPVTGLPGSRAVRGSYAPYGGKDVGKASKLKELRELEAAVALHLKDARDVSDEARDERGRWTYGGGWDGPTQETEDKLKDPSTEIKLIKANNNSGINSSWLAEATTRDGEKIPVMVKRTDENQAVAEIGTYEINKQMGFPVAQPETVLRDVKGISDPPGGIRNVVTTYVDGMKPFQNSSIGAVTLWQQQPYRDQMIGMAVLDTITSNVDRSPRNYLVSDDPTGHPGVVAIDHGYSYPFGDRYGGGVTMDLKPYGYNDVGGLENADIPQPILDGVQRFYDHPDDVLNRVVADGAPDTVRSQDEGMGLQGSLKGAAYLLSTKKLPSNT